MSFTAEQYPLGTVTLYGPTDKQATKLVASVFPTNRKDPAAVRKWSSNASDIREDAAIQTELSEFLKQHHVVHAVVTEEVVGCPHEPGIDYPAGESCPFCPFWSTHRRAVLQLTTRQNPGRNDPCACGSGKKFKKCCGAG